MNTMNTLPKQLLLLQVKVHEPETLNCYLSRA